MINNGYKITIDNDDVFGFIHSLRTEIEMLTEELIISEIARQVELLHDMSFCYCVQYQNSILDTAIEFVKGRTNGIRNGVFADDRYDMRSSINICKDTKEDEASYYCLFNSVNPKIKEYFEKLPYVKAYKYSPVLSGSENEEAGVFWHNVLERVNWNAALIGCGSQLTFQPDIEKIVAGEGFTDKMMAVIRKPEDRIDEFCRKQIVKDYVSDMIGKADISQIAPIVLTEFFVKANAYISTEQGSLELSELKEKHKKAFLPITLSNITAGSTSC